MPLSPGDRLGPYEVTALIGKGGMGEVYRARDTRLNREVAIKVSAERFTDRFEREARSIAALNHPHICTLYDVGPNYLVMELLAAETLADRLRNGPLRTEQVLQYGAQIAGALAAAHAKHIVHRDLKPGNVMVSKTGIKVLDFGLAKSLDDQATLTAGYAVMGTPAYMAPEQREGKACDARTDIYALGLMLYEMATGARVPLGQTLPLDSLSPRLAHVIERCLDSDPDNRWQTARDLKAELEYAAKSLPLVALNTTARIAHPRWIAGATAGVLALGLALGWAIAYFRQKAPELPLMRLEITPPPGARFQPDAGVAVSPKGDLLAFIARTSGADKLWVRPLNSSVPRELPGTDGAAFPFWSPNGRAVGFFAGGKLRRIDVSGGSPTVICDVGLGRGASWNADGTILFNSVNDGPLLRVSASGGTPVPFTTVDKSRKENSHRWPYFLPGGRRFLYFVRGAPETTGVYIGSLDRPQERVQLLTAPTNAVYAPGANGRSGHLLWVRAGTLMAQLFDAERAKVMHEPAVVAEGIAVGGASRLGAMSVSNNGTLLYAGSVHERSQPTWYGRDGKAQGILGPAEAYRNLRISPDGKGVALVRPPDIWHIEFARGIPVRIASGDLNTVWSPDSQRIVYTKEAPPNMYAQIVNSTATDERLSESHHSETPLDWSPDGRFLLYRVISNDLSIRTGVDLYSLPMTGNRKPVPLVATPFREGQGRFSPDGQWIAYTSDESGQDEIYVQKFPVNGKKGRVSTKGGDSMIWRKDGKELFYVSPDRKIMAVQVRESSGSLEFGVPNTLFGIPSVTDQGPWSYTYDVMPDGQRFLVLVPIGQVEVPPLTLVLNWQTELTHANK